MPFTWNRVFSLALGQEFSFSKQELGHIECGRESAVVGDNKQQTQAHCNRNDNYCYCYYCFFAVIDCMLLSQLFACVGNLQQQCKEFSS